MTVSTPTSTPTTKRILKRPSSRTETIAFRNREEINRRRRDLYQANAEFDQQLKTPTV